MYTKITAIAITSILPLLTHASIIVSESDEGVLKSEHAGVATIDFESGCGYVTCSGKYEIRLNTVGTENHSAPPFSATPKGEHWLTVPNPDANGFADFTLDADYNYFGLFWGSIDRYNTLSFISEGSEIASYTGTELAPLLSNGNQQSWTTNRFINFYFDDGMTYDAIKLTSTNWAFETDNHAFGNVSVPEPNSLLLLSLGLLGLGICRKRTGN